VHPTGAQASPVALQSSHMAQFALPHGRAADTKHLQINVVTRNLF